MRAYIRTILVLACLGVGCGDPPPASTPDGGSDAGPGRDAGSDDAGDERVDGAVCPTPDVDGDGRDSLACGGDDCDDDDPDRYPGNTEVCDAAGHDEDCNPSTFGTLDADGDGHVDAACCNTGASGPVCGDDCDDTQSGVHRDSPEVCNGRDDDCDTVVDETVLTTFYADCDADGFGGSESVIRCSAPTTPPTACPGALWIGVGGDCDDARGATNPSAVDTCNTRDDDCDGTPDDGADAWCASTLANTATAACTSGACSSVTCTTGYLDCDAAAGCEVDGTRDPESCGACGMRCAYSCSSSACDAAVEVRAGGTHACARRESGTVVCWGANTQGQLGDGTTTARPRAVPVVGLSDAVEIAAGVDHTCARRAGGTVVCWGLNDRGQLGDGSTVARSTTPVTVSGITNAVEVAASSLRTCARLATGRVMCWGAAGVGALGDGTTIDRPTPVMVSGLTDAIAIATGLTHTCAVRSGGTVMCWGANSQGSLGDGTRTARTTPVTVTTAAGVNLTGAIDVSAGDGFSCALRGAGTVACWGAGASGQLGDGVTTTTSRDRASPNVSGLSGANGISSGAAGRHTCVTRSSEVRCWGSNAGGQLGDGSTDHSWSPTSPVLLLVDQVGAGSFHTCALVRGSVYCWGQGGSGQLGDGEGTQQLRPVEALPPL